MIKLNLPEEIVIQILDAIEEDGDSETTNESATDALDGAITTIEYVPVPLDRHDELVCKASMFDAICRLVTSGNGVYNTAEIVRAISGSIAASTKGDA